MLDFACKPTELPHERTIKKTSESVLGRWRTTLAVLVYLPSAWRPRNRSTSCKTMEVGLVALTQSTKLAYLTSFVDAIVRTCKSCKFWLWDRNRERHRLLSASVSRVRPSQTLRVDRWIEINSILPESGYCPVALNYLSRYTRIAATKTSGETFSAFE